VKTRSIHELARLNLAPELQATLASGSDPNEKDNFGTTALQYAIAEKNDDAAAVLLENGADVTVQDSEGKTALHYAIEHGLPRLAELLLKKNPTVMGIGDNCGNEPLWTAAFNAKGNYELVSLLMRHGADPTHRNRVNLSPLDIARRKGDEALLHILQSRGACVS
jgi:hypothetical protein